MPFAVVAGALLVRIFIIFHDCGHGSFLRSKRGNDLIGFLTGVLTLTPYHHWRWEHSVHHATSGNLDRRGVGDIWTMTVREYRSASAWRRLMYRISRNPIILFALAPVAIMGVKRRFSASNASARERCSVWMTNLFIVAFAFAMSFAFGWKWYLLLQLIIVMVGGAAGFWIFYVQHQFDDVYWQPHDEWDFTASATQGSTYYALPPILQWFSGNIGFYHVHHLSPRIPNYQLSRCHRSHPIFQSVPPLTIRASLRSLRLHLWDEHNRRLVNFREALKN